MGEYLPHRVRVRVRVRMWMRMRRKCTAEGAGWKVDAAWWMAGAGGLIASPWSDLRHIVHGPDRDLALGEDLEERLPSVWPPREGIRQQAMELLAVLDTLKVGPEPAVGAYVLCIILHENYIPYYKGYKCYLGWPRTCRRCLWVRVRVRVRV